MYVTAAGMKIDIIQHRVSLVIKLRAEMFVFTRSVAHFQSVLLLSDHHRHGVSVHHLEETEAEEWEQERDNRKEVNPPKGLDYRCSS